MPAPSPRSDSFASVFGGGRGPGPTAHAERERALREAALAACPLDASEARHFLPLAPLFRHRDALAETELADALGRHVAHLAPIVGQEADALPTGVVAAMVEAIRRQLCHDDPAPAADVVEVILDQAFIGMEGRASDHDGLRSPLVAAMALALDDRDRLLPFSCYLQAARHLGSVDDSELGLYQAWVDALAQRAERGIWRKDALERIERALRDPEESGSPPPRSPAFWESCKPFLQAVLAFDDRQARRLPPGSYGVSAVGS